MRVLVAWILASVGLALAAATTAVMVFAFTEANEWFVHVSAFVVVPLAAQWAIGIAVGARPGSNRLHRITLTTGSIGIFLAGGAHMYFNGPILDSSEAVTPTPWVMLLVLGCICIAAAITSATLPGFNRVMSHTSATALAIFTGAVGAIPVIAFTGLPYSAACIALAALVAVAKLRPRNSRSTDGTSPSP